jgi:chaperonin GroES
MIKPAGHRLLVKPEQFQEKTAGGIFVPETTREKETKASMRGVVVEIGPTAWKAFDDGQPWAMVGDTVIFAKYAGVEVRENGSEYRLINDEDIIAVYQKAAV